MADFEELKRIAVEMDALREKAYQGDMRALAELASMQREDMGRDNPQNEKNIVADEWEKRAAAGDADAMYDLYGYYLRLSDGPDGERFHRDRALTLLRRAAKLQQLEAMNRLAVHYCTGLAITRNETKAANLLKKAADLGSDDALLRLIGLDDDVDITLDKKAFTRYYRQAHKRFTARAEAGDAEAMYILAEIIEQNPAQKEGDATADAVRHWQKKAAEGGYPRAMFDLANEYMISSAEGAGQKAVYWFEQAAEKGNFASALSLADYLRTGLGDVGTDAEKAAYWLQRAKEICTTVRDAGQVLELEAAWAGIEEQREKAEKGDADAMLALAEAHYDADGAEADMEKAFYWAEKAAKLGHVRAMVRLAGYYYGEFQDNAENASKAVSWYEKAAMAGDLEAKKDLAYCYINGDGVAQDDAKAFALLKEAAKTDDWDDLESICASLGNYYLYHESDADTAAHYYRISAQLCGKSGFNGLVACALDQRDYLLGAYWADRAAETGCPVDEELAAVCRAGLPRGFKRMFKKDKEFLRKVRDDAVATAKFAYYNGYYPAARLFLEEVEESGDEGMAEILRGLPEVKEWE